MQATGKGICGSSLFVNCFYIQKYDNNTWWSLKFEKKIILKKVGTHCRRFFCLRLSELYSRSVVSDSVTPLTEAYQASLVFTISRSLLKLTSLESVMPSKHLTLCHLLLLPSIFPSIRVFSSESALHQVRGTVTNRS